MSNIRVHSTGDENGRVVAWKDFHGVETLFAVVDQAGHQYGIYPSEREAIAAAEAAEPESTDDPACASFWLTPA
jgi:hypothetical protein